MIRLLIVFMIIMMAAATSRVEYLAKCSVDIADGLSEIFRKLYTGIDRFFAKPAPSTQRSFFG